MAKRFSVIHDGIDTQLAALDPDAPLLLPDGTLLSSEKQPSHLLSAIEPIEVAILLYELFLKYSGFIPMLAS